MSPKGLENFKTRYKAATGKSVSPGSPDHFQKQSNKWGAELRVYFNDSDAEKKFKSVGVNVEHRIDGYRAGEYTYRINDNKIWWELVELHGLRLGSN